MNKKIIIIGLIIVIVILGITLIFRSPKGPEFAGTTNFTNVSAEDLTATDDLSVTDDATISGGLTVSEDLVANNVIKEGALSIASGSETLTATQVCDNSTLLYEATSAATLTFPTASNLAGDCLDTLGDGKELEIHCLEASSNDLTLSAGTGMDFDLASGSSGSPVLIAGESALIYFRKTNTSSVSSNIIEFK